MKKETLSLAIAASLAATASADDLVQPTALEYDAYYAQPSDALPPTPTADAFAPAGPVQAVQAASASCDLACGDIGCCDSACGDSVCCGSSCSLMGGCCLGDAWTLQGEVDPCGCLPFDFGGWTQFGFHSDNVRLSSDRNDGLAFNDRDDRLNLHQQWFWFEKAAEAPCCG
ncbi:MAG: hypothetical protein AAF805_10515, partial [Planctomycetota bacterium]